MHCRDGSAFWLEFCNGFDFAQYTLGKLPYCHTATGRLGDKILLIHLIEFCKIVHICQKTGGFEYAFETNAGGFQNFFRPAEGVQVKSAGTGGIGIIRSQMFQPKS